MATALYTRCSFGVYSGSTSAHTALETTVGAKIPRYVTYQDMGSGGASNWPTTEATWCKSTNHTLDIAWDMVSHPYLMTDITSGAADASIDAFFQAAKTHGDKVILRMFWEMNIGPGPSKAGLAGGFNQNTTAAQWVAAWRYIYNRAKVTVGATNVWFFWCPNGADSGSPLYSASQLYPGDAYVDINGYDTYNNPDWANGAWHTFDQQTSGPDSLVLAPATDKTQPMGIGELGTTNGTAPNDANSFWTGMYTSTLHPYLRYVDFFHNVGGGWDMTAGNNAAVIATHKHYLALAPFDPLVGGNPPPVTDSGPFQLGDDFNVGVVLASGTGIKLGDDFNIVPPPPVLPSAVSGFILVPYNSAIMILWQPPLVGTALGYQMDVEQPGTGGTGIGTSGDMRYALATGLINDVLATVTIYARNEVGNGPSLTLTAMPTASAGTAPQNPFPDPPTGLNAEAGDTEVLLKWDMPLTKLPTTYTVTVSSDVIVPGWSDGFGSPEVITISAPATFYIVTGLVNTYAYWFELTASNPYGGWSYGPTVTATPMPGLVIHPPGPPPPPPPPPPYLIRDVFPPILPTPPAPSIPVTQQRVADLLARIAAQAVPGLVAGQVQMAALVDDLTGEVFVITPSVGGVYLNDLDLGYPSVREVSTSWPNRHGAIDDTMYYGERAVTMSLTCMDAPDPSGIIRSASAWADAARSWSALGRKVRLVYQLLDQLPRQVSLRTSQLGSPIVGSGVDRIAQKVTMGWKSPDPFLCTVPALSSNPGYADPARPGWFHTAVGSTGAPNPAPPPSNSPGLNFHGATGINFANATGINFGGGGAAVLPGGGGVTGGDVVGIPKELTGSVPVAPVITVLGGVTQPKFSLLGRNGVLRSSLEFRATVGVTNLVVASTDTLVIDVGARTAKTYPGGDLTQPGTSVYKFLAIPAQWESFVVQPQDANTFHVFPVGSNTDTTTWIAWQQAWA